MKKFNELYQLIIQSLTNNTFENENIILIPLDSNSISSYFLHKLNSYSDMFDNVILMLSNITKQKKQNQQLSISNLEQIIKILNYFKDEQQKPIQMLISEIQNNENITFKYLNEKIAQIILKSTNSAFKKELDKAILNIRQNIFKNVQNKEQLNIKQQELKTYIKEQNLNNIIIQLSKLESPVDDIIQLINSRCKKCEITINMKDSKNLQKYLVKENQNILK